MLGQIYLDRAKQKVAPGTVSGYVVTLSHLAAIPTSYRASAANA